MLEALLARTRITVRQQAVTKTWNSKANKKEPDMDK